MDSHGTFLGVPSSSSLRHLTALFVGLRHAILYPLAGCLTKAEANMTAELGGRLMWMTMYRVLKTSLHPRLLNL